MATTAWQVLTALESRLHSLEQECLAYPRKGGWRALDHWYKTIKPSMCRLVGFYRQPTPGDEALRTPWAYDTCYSHLLGVLQTRRPKRRAS